MIFLYFLLECFPERVAIKKEFRAYHQWPKILLFIGAFVKKQKYIHKYSIYRCCSFTILNALFSIESIFFILQGVVLFYYAYSISNCPAIYKRLLFRSLIYSLIQFATNSPSFTGTALPITCSRTVLLPLKTKFFGNV
jgi:hypothetical protein